MSFFKIIPDHLADGREVITRLPAAHIVEVTPNYFSELAKREGLQRFARRNSKGGQIHYWLLTEVEALKAKRQAIEVDLPSDTIVPLPYGDGKA